MKDDSEHKFNDSETQAESGALLKFSGISNYTSFTDNQDSSQHARSEHLGATRQYWRDCILGVNDGLISTFLLVAGVAGGGLSSTDILLTAIAGAIAGAVSMCAGEYVATKSQNEVIRGEIALERVHVEHYLDEELTELGGLLDLIGIASPKDDRLRRELKEFYRRNPDSLLQIMTALEFGLLETEQRSPIRAGLFSCGLFATGALPSVIPFIFFGDKPKMGLLAAAALTISALMVVGAVKTWATRTNWLTAALENLIIAGCGGAFAYTVGLLFNALIEEVY